MGHPLLDISATVNSDFMKKYDLKEDDVILGSEKHANLVDDLVANFEVKFTPGGSTQNAIRVSQWLMSKPGSTAFLGTIGPDLFGQIMTDVIRKEGVYARYIEIDDKPTGQCVVLITSQGLKRSLVSFPGAARSLDTSHIPWPLVQTAKMIYSAGFTLTTGFEVVLQLAQHCRQERKLFCLNLSACYISLTQTEKLQQVLPFVDILFGNESEARAFAQAVNWPPDDLPAVIRRLATSFTSNGSARCVIITQGCDPCLAGSTGEKEIRCFPVQPIASDEIVDTNCAGDAFVGGFLGYFALHGIPEEGDIEPPSAGSEGLSLLTRCVKEGIFCARQIIRVSGCDVGRLKQLSNR